MKKTICIITVLAVIVFVFCSCRNEYYKEYEVQYFGEKTYNEINEPCSAEDKAELKPVLKLAEKAFSAFPKSEKEAEKQFGELYQYTN